MSFTSDVLIYVNDQRAAAQVPRISSALSTRPGVTGARALPKLERVIHVEYDPHTTDTQSLLAAVRGHGVDACLVGL
jgi:hypothetical protein